MRKAAVLLLTLACALAVAAKDKPDKQKRRGRGQSDTRVQAHVTYSSFLPQHRTVILDWYRSPRGLPPGIAKKCDLPPGLEKQLRRKGHLPPGLAKKMYAFPPVLVEQLPPVPYGCERAFLGHIAIIWNPRTRVIFDFTLLD